MAKVGIHSVSYGIGVQNRYSAFLDDESGLNSPSASSVARKRTENIAANKQKVATSNLQNNNKSNNTNSLSGKTNTRTVPKNKLQDHQKSGNQTEQKRSPLDGKRQRANVSNGQQQQGANNLNQASRQMASGRTQGNHNQDNAANNDSRFSSNFQHSNNHHQSNVSHNQPNFPSNNNNKENNELRQQQQGKYVPRNNNGNQRVRRQYHADDKKAAIQNLEEGTANSLPVGAQSNEEEKRRRQQKRALDLKYKDPEKRDARRQQVAPGEPSMDSLDNQADLAQGDHKVGPRNRRQFIDGNKNPDDVARPGFRSAPGGGRGRGRREPGPAGEMAGERRDGQANRGDRPQRNRNGFGSGSRGSRGSRGEDQGKFGRDSDRQKPIPNFSDKFDFPSLAS